MQGARFASHICGSLMYFAVYLQVLNVVFPRPLMASQYLNQ